MRLLTPPELDGVTQAPLVIDYIILHLSIAVMVPAVGLFPEWGVAPRNTIEHMGDREFVAACLPSIRTVNHSTQDPGPNMVPAKIAENMGCSVCRGF